MRKAVTIRRKCVKKSTRDPFIRKFIQREAETITKKYRKSSNIKLHRPQRASSTVILLYNHICAWVYNTITVEDI